MPLLRSRMTSVPDTVNPHLVSTSAAPTSSQSVEQLPSAAIDFANRVSTAELHPLASQRADKLILVACRPLPNVL